MYSTSSIPILLIPLLLALDQAQLIYDPSSFSRFPHHRPPASLIILLPLSSSSSSRFPHHPSPASLIIVLPLPSSSSSRFPHHRPPASLIIVLPLPSSSSSRFPYVSILLLSLSIVLHHAQLVYSKQEVLEVSWWLAMKLAVLDWKAHEQAPKHLGATRE
jgi:hypothetical protein